MIESCGMPPEGMPPSYERAATDESLRAERDKADQALAENVAAIDERADAVITHARARADALLAAARAKTDERPSVLGRGPLSMESVARDRAVADRALQGERADADRVVREERDEQVAVLAHERKETDDDLEDERARSDDALAVRDDFLGIVTHDLRNMLMAMVGFASMIEHEVAADDHVEQVRKHAQRIQRSGARMNRLIGDLVDIASIGAGVLAVTREVGDPSAVVTEAIENFQAQASARGVSLACDMTVPVPRAAFDHARILQVLTNLLSNAIKFTPEKGSVLLGVKRVGSEVHFVVTDTGKGIPEGQLEAIFARFVQVTENDRRGLGLGLYISKCIVQGHGGRIWAESKLGAGSTFSFTLPALDAA